MALQVEVKSVFLFALLGCLFGLGSSDLVDPKESKLVLYGKSGTDTAEYTLSQAKDLLSDERFKDDRNTTIFLPDYTESRLKICLSHHLADAYTETQVANFITIFYSPAEENEEDLDDVDEEGLSELLAAFMSDMSGQVDWKSIHLLGYASGSNLTALVAKELDEKYDLQLARISLLDPTFQSQDLVQMYVKAEFVDAIYTSYNKYGTPIPVAIANFFMNGGAVQIQCYADRTDDNACNHHDVYKCSQRFAWEYWADTVRNGPDGPYYCGHHMDKDYNFEGEPAVMGYYCPWTANGSYYAYTSVYKPYARDESCG